MCKPPLQSKSDCLCRMWKWFQQHDIIIVDHGYRDVVNTLTDMGLNVKMLLLLGNNKQQFSTEEANSGNQERSSENYFQVV